MMLRERAHIIDAALRASDLLALTASFLLAYLVRDGLLGEKVAGRPGLYPIERYWPLLVLTLLAWVTISWLSRLYEAYRLRTLATETRLLAQTMVFVAAFAAATGFLTKQGSVSRQFVCFYFVFGMGLLFTNRLLLRSVLYALRRHGYSTRIVAVVGTNDLARQVAEGIVARRDWGYHFAGYIEAPDEPGPSRVGPVIGDLSRLGRMLENKVLDEIIFAVTRERLVDVEAAVLLCREKGVTARICLDLPLRGMKELYVEQLDGIPMLSVY
jgi:FlaA1/EpsC-like NDP-sugar epimerase